MSYPLSNDEIFDLLSARRRRILVLFLEGTDEEPSLMDLAGQIAAKEMETDPENVTRKQRKRVYVALYQTHIPKLEDAGVIEYDDANKVVELTDRAQLLLPYLRLDPTEEQPSVSRPISSLKSYFINS